MHPHLPQVYEKTEIFLAIIPYLFATIQAGKLAHFPSSPRFKLVGWIASSLAFTLCSLLAEWLVQDTSFSLNSLYFLGWKMEEEEISQTLYSLG